MSNGEATKLTKANNKSHSLRTTVPVGIVKQFDLAEGDQLLWQILADEGQIILHVRPLRRTEDND
jgi:bifunctional DNA-binding transcriptional regulator/antitoxin component of YhaV-PrlF toxin-antitoxin module